MSNQPHIENVAIPYRLGLPGTDWNKVLKGDILVVNVIKPAQVGKKKACLERQDMHCMYLEIVRFTYSF